MAAVLLLLSLLSLHSHSFSVAESIINIDCGSNGTHDDVNNVTWVGDKRFVTIGETMEITKGEKPFNTLRYFPNEPNGTDNCYNNIPGKKGEKILVRTKFYNGNYDGKLSPFFIVLYDKTYFDFVVITNSSKYYFSEVIFAPADETISICLRSPPSHNPFISSIEVYSLDAGMYDDLGPNEVLIYQSRTRFGGTKRLRDDYGRRWLAAQDKNNSDVTVLGTSPREIGTSGASNKPPEKVMFRAFSEEGLTLYNLALSSTKLPVYLALYFSEPVELEKRSFNVSLDGEQVSSDPIVPVFGKTTQVVKRDIEASSASNLTFQSTEDSNFPPIINALEVYVLLKAITGNQSFDQYNGYEGGGGDDFDFYDDILEPTVDERALGERKTYVDLYDLLRAKKLNVNDVAAAKEAAKEAAKRAVVDKKKLALGLGIGLPVSFAALISSVVFCCKKSRTSKPKSNTEPTTSSGKPNA